MPILNPDHLFDQADRLAAAPASGRPRQVDLRRAISKCLVRRLPFHNGRSGRRSRRCQPTLQQPVRAGLPQLDHRTLRNIRGDIAKQTPPRRLAPYLPLDGFGADIQAFARTTIDLQEKRHRADYNPEPRYRSSEATLAIGYARSAVRHFGRASQERKKAFLTLLLCPPR